MVYWISYERKTKLFPFQVILKQTDLPKCNSLSSLNEFHFSRSSHTVLPHVIQPTKIRNNSKILIDKIYSNVITRNTILVNLTTTIFCNLTQYQENSHPENCRPDDSPPDNSHPENFQQRKFRPRITPTCTIPTKGNSHLHNSQPKNSHPDYCNPENPV